MELTRGLTPPPPPPPPLVRQLDCDVRCAGNLCLFCHIWVMSKVTGPYQQHALAPRAPSGRPASTCPPNRGTPCMCERVLFIGTQFSNLYTAVDTPARGRVCVCVVFVCLGFACKYVLGHSRVSQPLNLRLCLSGTLAFSLRLMPPRSAADAALTYTGSSAALHPTLLPFHGPIPFTFLPRPDLHYIHLL